MRLSQRTDRLSLSLVVTLAAIFWVGSDATAQGAGPDPTLANLDYGLPGSSHPLQRLDFYQSSVPSPKPKPAIVWIHGKGFWGGSKDIDVSILPFSLWLETGWSIVSLDYRLSGQTFDEMINGPDQALYPQHVEDVSLAVQFIRMNAVAWDIDPDKIMLYGDSAGGLLATWVGLADDQAAFMGGVGHGAGLSTRVRAVRNHRGPTDWTYVNAFADPDANPYFGVFFPDTLPYATLVPVAKQLEASSFWQATQQPQAGPNQHVGVWQSYSGPLAGDLHDPFYGVRLNDAVRSIGNAASVLNWDLSPDFPPGLNFDKTIWMRAQFTSIPYGQGTTGTLSTPPAFYLRTMGPTDTFLIANAPPNADVTIALGLGQIDQPLFGGSLYVQPLLFLYGTTDANGVLLRDLEIQGAEGLFDVFCQAAIEDPNANGGYVLTQGLKLDLE